MKTEDLLKHKKIIDEKNEIKYDSFKVKSLEGIGDGKVTIRSIDDDEYDAILRSSKDDYEVNKNALYRAVTEPNLQDKALQEGFDCKANPLDIVRKIFSRVEIDYISGRIGKLSNLTGGEDIIQEIKNE